MDITENWKAVKDLFRASFKSSFHYAIATVNGEGEPHVTPIGSLILGKPGHGLYFEEFPRKLPANYKINQQACVLAVNSSRWYWIKSLFTGRFSSPPAVRLHGLVGEIREASEKEIKFTRIEPVHMGKMTHDTLKKVWNATLQSEPEFQILKGGGL